MAKASPLERPATTSRKKHAAWRAKAERLRRVRVDGSRLCAISVDLDEIHHYRAIHGLGAAKDGGASLVYDRALPRFKSFATDHELPLTLFAVGSDLERPASARRLADLARAGHEIGNHTFDHFYDLSRRTRDDVAAQIVRAADVITARCGQAPTGFRAPGYAMSETVYQALADCGVAYSSSVFPSPPYYLAKLLALCGQRLVGRESESILDSPHVLRAPGTPYHTGQPYYVRGGGVLELPIQVTPRLRLPFIGTSLMLLGPNVARRMTRSLVGQPFVNLELHGVDLLDRHDGLQELAAHQFDLRVPLGRKWRTLAAVVGELREAGYRFVRLEEAAQHFRRPAAAAA